MPIGYYQPSMAHLYGILYHSRVRKWRIQGNYYPQVRRIAVPPTGRQARAPGSQSRPTSFEALIRSCARKYRLDEDLIKAVIKAESNFKPHAVSPAGAKGLMQLMDGTARSLGVRNSFDPGQNIEGGVRFLRQLLDRFGSVSLALAAYNAGPGAVEKYGGIPPYRETQTYVPRVISLWERYRNDTERV